MMRRAIVIMKRISLRIWMLLEPAAIASSPSLTLPWRLTDLAMTVFGRVSGTKIRQKAKTPPIMMLM